MKYRVDLDDDFPWSDCDIIMVADVFSVFISTICRDLLDDSNEEKNSIPNATAYWAEEIYMHCDMGDFCIQDIHCT